MEPPVNHNKDTKPGYLLVNKPIGKTAFSLVAVLRKQLGIRKIGHAGTLDPLATGVMVMLIGKEYTKLSDQFLCEDKEYLAQIHLGVETDTYDSEGQQITTSDFTPSLEEIKIQLAKFQGEIEQTPPMFSAKKINGQKLYHLARQGKTIERPPSRVRVALEVVAYRYPHLDLRINCSKGTYIRSIAHDLGKELGCGAHLSGLVRTRSGNFHLRDCLNGELLYSGPVDLQNHIQRYYSNLN